MQEKTYEKYYWLNEDSGLTLERIKGYQLVVMALT